jgi:hypothetical protein
MKTLSHDDPEDDALRNRGIPTSLFECARMHEWARLQGHVEWCRLPTEEKVAILRGTRRHPNAFGQAQQEGSD